MCVLCANIIYSRLQILILIYLYSVQTLTSLLHFTHIAFIQMCTEYSVQIFSVAFLSTFPQLLCLQSAAPWWGRGYSTARAGESWCRYLSWGNKSALTLKEGPPKIILDCRFVSRKEIGRYSARKFQLVITSLYSIHKK